MQCGHVIGELMCERKVESSRKMGNGLEFFLYNLTFPLGFLAHSNVNSLHQISHLNLLVVELT